MPVRFLSEEWVAKHLEAGAALDTRIGVTAIIETTVKGGPDGTVTYHVSFTDGRVDRVGLGADDDAEIAVLMPFDVALRIADGSLDPSLAFMRGESKVQGNMGKYVSLLPLTQHDDHRRFVEAIHVDTTYD